LKQNEEKLKEKNDIQKTNTEEALSKIFQNQISAQ